MSGSGDVKASQEKAKAEQAPLKVVVILGTVRQGRMGPRVAKFIVEKLKARKHEVTLLDPAELKFPLVEQAHHHILYAKGTPPEHLSKVAAILEAADAIIPVSAEYNHSMPPALTNLMDAFGGKAYMFRASAIVTYSRGTIAGARAGVQLRSLLGELGAVSVKQMLAVPQVDQTFDEHGVTKDKHLDSTADRLIVELEWAAQAFRNHRELVGTP